MIFTTVKELKQDEFLYEAGAAGDTFWFLVTGKMEMLVKPDGEFKYSKGVDESNFFGKKEFYTETRGDYAKVVTPKAVLLVFQTVKFNNIISKTQISEGQKKIDFLIRYVPGFRELPKRQIEDFEVFFIKEQVTQGF